MFLIVLDEFFCELDSFGLIGWFLLFFIGVGIFVKNLKILIVVIECVVVSWVGGVIIIVYFVIVVIVFRNMMCSDERVG